MRVGRIKKSVDEEDLALCYGPADTNCCPFLISFCGPAWASLLRTEAYLSLCRDPTMLANSGSSCEHGHDRFSM